MWWRDTFRFLGMMIAGLLVMFVIILGVGWLQMELESQSRQSSPEQYCSRNLKQIGGLLLGRQCEHGLEHIEGGTFVLQVLDEVQTEDIHAFRCPNGPRHVLTSYRGPDAHLLDLLKKGGRGPDGKSLIIACDANGENGDEPHHDGGICVLYNTGKVEFIRWEQMEGYDGGPVKVGPGSPDPRFRHLVR